MAIGDLPFLMSHKDMHVKLWATSQTTAAHGYGDEAHRRRSTTTGGQGPIGGYLGVVKMQGWRW